jgi:hypothetical protein
MLQNVAIFLAHNAQNSHNIAIYLKEFYLIFS